MRVQGITIPLNIVELIISYNAFLRVAPRHPLLDGIFCPDRVSRNRYHHVAGNQRSIERFFFSKLEYLFVCEKFLIMYRGAGIRFCWDCVMGVRNMTSYNWIKRRINDRQKVEFRPALRKLLFLNSNVVHIVDTFHLDC
jgi:hypothetical protein